MAKAYIILLGIILSCNQAYAQNSDSEPQYIHPDWKVGTEKTIFQIDSTIVYMADSVFMMSAVKSTYTIKIEDVTESNYEISFTQMAIDNDVVVESELLNTSSIESHLQMFFEEMQREMEVIDYSILVDKNTANAYEVLNGEELEIWMKKFVVTGLKNFIDTAEEKSGKDVDQEILKNIESMAQGLIQEQMPAIEQTMLNAFNHIFQFYSFPFVLDEVYTTDINLYDVDEMNHGGTTSMAKLNVSSSIEGPILNIDYNYEYDKEEAYQNTVVAQGRENEVSIDEFNVEEGSVLEIDLTSSWLNNSYSCTRVDMGSLRVFSITYVEIEY